MAFLKQFISLSLIFSIAHTSMAFAGRHGHTSDDEQGGGSSPKVVTMKVTTTTKKDSSSSDESLSVSPKRPHEHHPSVIVVFLRKDLVLSPIHSHLTMQVRFFLLKRIAMLVREAIPPPVMGFLQKKRRIHFINPQKGVV